MRLKKLVLNNFRNYSNASVLFNSEVVCIVGENGAGKTNLIDAIYYISLTKSSLNNVDSQNINHGQDYFYIKGEIEKGDNDHHLLLALEKGKKKAVKVNGIEYEKLSEHIGRFPVIMIAPDDVTILLGGSEERRKFFDGSLSQTSQEYLSNLISYNKYLKQRNSALKSFAETGRTDHTLLELYDDHLVQFGKKIYQQRKAHLKSFIPDFTKHYKFISDEKEEVKIIYKSDFDGTLDPKSFRQKDLILQRTTWGSHKDDYEFLIHEMPLKKYASQGQRKSFLTALKLAQFDFIYDNVKIKPILLLDDIFDKLDDKRISHLLDMIGEGRFGQTFFTDARSAYTSSLFGNKGIDFQTITIEDGNVAVQ